MRSRNPGKRSKSAVGDFILSPNVQERKRLDYISRE